MVSRCEYCSGLSVETLVDLAKKEFPKLLFPRKAYYEHHQSFDQLAFAAHQGCDLCQLILECFKGAVEEEGMEWTWPREWTPDPPPGAATMYLKAKSLPESNVRLCIDIANKDDGTPLRDVQLFDVIQVQVGLTPEEDLEQDMYGRSDSSKTSEPLPWRPKPLSSLRLLLTNNKGQVHPDVSGYLIGRLEVDRDLGSISNLALARNWFDECVCNHPDCWPDEVPFTPNRLLDVQPQNGIQDHIRLVELDQDTRTRYAVLSHCWGGQIKEILNKSKFEQYTVSISCSSLAANFRDAITITRNLDIPYLWIDSLCIIQGDKADWEKEAGQMASVYRNAAVSIFAAASSDSTGGLLNNRPVVPGPSDVKLRVYSDSDNTLITLSRRDEPSDENLRSICENGPLASRGWTLQESILSSRSISYGLHGVYWECPSEVNAANGLPDQGKVYPWKPQLLSAILYPYADDSTSENALSESSMGSAYRLDLLAGYYDLIEGYCRRNLTQASDKLPAMSALAKTFGDVLGNDNDNTKYLAGLWSIDILYGLMWRPRDIHAPHLSKYRAPSWSWAVTDTPIYWGMKYLRKLWGIPAWELEVLEHHVQHVSDGNPFGEVESGHLIVRGPIIPVLRSRQVINHRSVPDDQLGSGFYDDPSSTREEQDWRQTILEVGRGDGTQWATFNVDLEADREELHIDEELYHSDEYKILIIFAKDGLGGEKYFTGLFIKRLPDSGSYERAGYLSGAAMGYEEYELLQRETIKLV